MWMASQLCALVVVVLLAGCAHREPIETASPNPTPELSAQEPVNVSTATTTILPGEHPSPDYHYGEGKTPQ